MRLALCCCSVGAAASPSSTNGEIDAPPPDSDADFEIAAGDDFTCARTSAGGLLLKRWETRTAS